MWPVIWLLPMLWEQGFVSRSHSLDSLENFVSDSILYSSEGLLLIHSTIWFTLKDKPAWERRCPFTHRSLTATHSGNSYICPLILMPCIQVLFDQYNNHKNEEENEEVGKRSLTVHAYTVCQRFYRSQVLIPFHTETSFIRIFRNVSFFKEQARWKEGN